MYEVNDPWMKVWLDTMGYKLNVYTEAIIESTIEKRPRFTLIYGGERSGKSFNTVAIAGIHVPPNKYRDQKMYWIVGPDFNQCRAEFQYLFSLYSKLGLVTRFSMPEATTVRWYMELSTNERWETRSSADVSKLASFSIHGALIVEANQQSIAVWHKIRGRLAENRGWCVMSGTYENVSEWFVDTYEKWHVPNNDNGVSYSLPTWANTVSFPGGYEDEEIQALKRSVPETWFLERYAGIPSKPSNLVLPEFDYIRHVGSHSMNPQFPVELAIDPGKRCYCVAFVQTIGETIVVLDCVYKKNWIAQKVIPNVMKHPLWKYVSRNGYAGSMDIAGFAEPATISQAELWRDIANIELYARKYPEIETINTIREALALDQILFSNMGNESMNGEAIEPLAEFRLWKWRDEGEAMSERGSPIDRNNHFTKALGYYRLWKFGQTTQKHRRNRKPNKPKPRSWSAGTRAGDSNTRRVRAKQIALRGSGNKVGAGVEAPVLERGAEERGGGFRRSRASHHKHSPRPR